MRACLALVFCSFFTAEVHSGEATEIVQDITAPNIVYVLADDMGYGDLYANNPDSKIPTPHLDQMAAEGMRFTDAHSPASVCTPTRYGILTGEYAFRSKRLRFGALRGYGHPMIEQDRMTVARLLQQEGYATAIIGKWHLGLNWAIKPEHQKAFTALLPDKDGHTVVKETNSDWIDFTRPITEGPLALGFDYSYIVPASLDYEPYVFLENDELVELPTDYTDGQNINTDGRGVFYRKGLKAPSFDIDQTLSVITEKAVDYIETKAPAATPYFLYVPFTAPHPPWLPGKTFQGISEAGDYGDFVAMVDDVAGQIIAAVEASGEAQNTLIIFTSDNAPNWKEQHIAMFGHYASGIYRGKKGDVHEGAHRMPFIVKWPARVQAGSVSDHTTTQTNLMATVAHLTGARVPDGAGKDSRSILPVLMGEASEPEILVHQTSSNMFSVRDGDWKFIDGLGSGGFTKPKWIDPVPGGPSGQLFNLAKDPQESENLYLKHPEIVARMRALLEEKRKGT